MRLGPSLEENMKALLRNAPGAPLWRLLRHMGDERSLNLALLARDRPAGLFQPEPTTEPNRYPKFFRFVRERLGDGPHLNILSFGCATGEEVFSLRQYFPQARIKGIDINKRNIRRCRESLARRGGDPALFFETAGSAALEPKDSYDAIFALAVFRHGGLGDAPPRCDHLIRFCDFDRVAGGLAACLKPGGLLALRYANFRFVETGAAAAFRQIYAASQPGQSATPLYGRDNRLSPHAEPDDGVFEKTA
jgi:2-polyprenyl-3-methyl-5-hydroxy-6-metoxy-1,4-benzoquinol methylase